MKTLLLFLMTAMVWAAPISNSTTLQNDLIGVWVPDGYEGGNEKYIKSTEFNSQKHGMSFSEDGKMIMRNSAGWCATPPISYGHHDGIWKLTADSVLQMKYRSWNGERNSLLTIVKLEKGVLVVK